VYCVVGVIAYVCLLGQVRRRRHQTVSYVAVFVLGSQLCLYSSAVRVSDIKSLLSHVGHASTSVSSISPLSCVCVTLFFSCVKVIVVTERIEYFKPWLSGKFRLMVVEYSQIDYACQMTRYCYNKLCRVIRKMTRKMPYSYFICEGGFIYITVIFALS